MMADAKATKRYHASVERALALFDATNEWADYIAFLSRLLKSLQDPPANVEIPLKRTIARHLAQCLQPSLPAGVHQKALEVYDLIFSIIGTQGLENDLVLYLPGLSHTLAFASLATRPQILALYDEHILVLSTKTIRPALRALILSLLPGLEEETSEDFDNTLFTFSKLREKFSDDGHEELFWQNLFLASVTNPHRRAGVLVYLTRQLPKLHQNNSVQKNETNNGIAGGVHAVTTPEPGLLVRCFATGLQDEQPLIQRGFLDLLVSHLPLNAEVFVDARHRQDLDVLVTAATAVVLKRDMSLNRRLWAWFTGSETNSATSADQGTGQEASQPSTPLSPRAEKLDSGYFSTYALAALIRSLRAMISIPSSDVSLQVRPFRVALSLMDRWEIGGPVVESIFVPLIKALQDYQSSAPTQDAFDEVFRSANVFFDGIDGRLVASQLIKLVEEHEFQLVMFIITNFNLEDGDMTRYHIPLVSLFVADRLRECVVSQENDGTSNIRYEDANILANALQDLLELITTNTVDYSEFTDSSSPDQNWRGQVLEFYDNNYRSKKSMRLPLARTAVLRILSDNIANTYLNSCTVISKDGVLLNNLTICLQRSIVLMNDFTALRQLNFSERLLSSLGAINSQDSMRFVLTKSTTAILASLRIRDTAEQALSRESLCNSIPTLVRLLWYFLQASTPQYHIEAVESIWRLHALVRNDSIVESTILSVMLGSSSAKQIQEEEVLRFSVLWSHSITLSKPFLEGQVGQQASNAEIVLSVLSPSLWCMIDRSKPESPTDPVSNWMRSLSTLAPIFHLVFGADLVSSHDEQVLALALDRTLKLVHIAKGSPALWEIFVKQEDQFGAVRNLCSYLISEQIFRTKLGLEALSLIKTILDYGHRDLGNDLITLIMTQLSKTHDIDTFQNALLDTLLAVFPGSGAALFVDTLLPILLDGIVSPFTDAQTDKWVTLLCNIVPLMNLSQLMANLLKITSCLCKRLETYFSALQDLFRINPSPDNDEPSSNTLLAAYPERSISNLLAGMEYILARAHQQVLSGTQRSDSGVNGSMMDLSSSRSSANDRLTVVLCMQDTLKVCVALWLWRSSSRSNQNLVDLRSLNHTSAKLRARSRRILENLIEAEPQECLETLMGLWIDNRKSNTQHTHILELLQTLDGARPKYMMPATFNALYSRTNPAALDSSQRSTLSININAFELTAFLNDYTNALEDDLLDEIWGDCSTVLKEILANPMPHRQILLRMLEFAAVLCRKMDNTNFSDESRMRKELADICVRLFTAIFTIKPGGLDNQGSKAADTDAVFQRKQVSTNFQSRPGNVLQVICQTLPDISAILSYSDRLIPVYNSIATNITGPMLHSKLFPSNLSAELLILLQSISTAPSGTKAWKKDITDAFNDGRFFQSPIELVELGWLPLIRQLSLIDKTLMPELLSRIIPPATAGLMFGVGATTARIEADKKMSITLRRIALLLISMETDYFTPYLKQELTKTEELLSATPETSPSSATRSDIYILLRAILLTHSQAQLAPLWPLVDSELADLCNDIITNNSNNTTTTNDSIKFTMSAKLQGAKLLDLLLLLQPDEFQLHEWLFVTDTVDAIYPPDDTQSNALADQIGALNIDNHLDPVRTSTSTLLRAPWLCSDESRDPEKITQLLSGFFSQLSIRAFEGNYSLLKIDLVACRRDLIKDLFAES